jgi:hypothetical protein
MKLRNLALTSAVFGTFSFAVVACTNDNNTGPLDSGRPQEEQPTVDQASPLPQEEQPVIAPSDRPQEEQPMVTPSGNAPIDDRDTAY